MTEQEWSEVAEKLRTIGARVQLDCDGYKIVLACAPLNDYRNCIKVTIPGKAPGGLLVLDCEERRRFARPIERKLKFPSGVEHWKCTPEELKRIEADRIYTVYCFEWPNLYELQQHLELNNRSIRLI